jgi:hypothetical protein
MKRKFLIIIIAFLLSAIFLPYSFASNSTTTNDDSENSSKMSSVSLAFVQTAPQATLEYSNSRNTYKLTLYNINPYITYFAKRPSRFSGVVPVMDFVKAWGVGTNSFLENPPNAIITAGYIDDVANNNGIFFAMTLQIQSYNTIKGTLEYKATPLSITTLVSTQFNLRNVTIVID